MYYVYVHTVPNGKIYVGQAKNLVARWNNGEGYVDNRPFYKDITIYGWNNIKHDIVAEFDNRESALQLEAVLIALLKSEDDKYGYNQTKIYTDAMKKYVSRVPANNIALEQPTNEVGFFESFNLPLSVCEELINQWIFNEEHRNIMKSRLLDGLSYDDLSKKYGKSIRQLKNIVYNGCSKLEKRL